jgi:glutaredoxin
LQIRRRNIELRLNLAEEDEDPYGDEEEVSEHNIVSDYELVKRSLRKSLSTTQRIIDLLMDDFEALPSVERAEVISRVLESLGNSSEKLLKSSKTMAEIAKIIKSVEPEKEQPIIFKDATFVGSLSDLFKLQKEKKALENKKEIPQIEEKKVEEKEPSVALQFALNVAKVIDEKMQKENDKILEAEIIKDGE